MDPFTLRCFVAVAREGSFSRAADRLYRSQPAVSLQVRKLEREIGRPLFDRSRRAPVLTDAGRVLLAESADLLDRLEALTGLVAGTREGPSGTLAIASNLSLIGHFLPPLAGAFHARFPLVRLRLLNRTARGIVRSLAEREADLGIGFLVGDDPDVTSGVLDRSPFVLVAPRGRRVAGRAAGGPPTLAEALAGPLVHFEDDVDLRRHVERAFARRGSLAPVVEVPSIESILTFVAAGFGTSILPAFAVSGGWRKRLLVRELGPTPTPLEIRWYVDRRRPLSRAAVAFRDICGGGDDEERTRDH
jgi:DNA-binding transcriptional LysR family regulator